MKLVRFTALLGLFVLGLTYGNYSSANDLTNFFKDMTQKYVADTVGQVFNGANSEEMETAQSGKHYLHIKRGSAFRKGPSINAEKHRFTNKVATVKDMSFTGNMKLVEEYRGQSNSKFRSRWYELQDSNGQLYYLSSSRVPQETQQRLRNLIAQGVIVPSQNPLAQRQTPQVQQGTICEKSPISYSYKGLSCNDKLQADQCIQRAFMNKNNGFSFGKTMNIQDELHRQNPQQKSSFDRIVIKKREGQSQRGRVNAKIFNSQNQNEYQHGNGNFCTDASGQLAIYRLTYIDRQGNYKTRDLVLNSDFSQASPRVIKQNKDLPELGQGTGISFSAR